MSWNKNTNYQAPSKDFYDKHKIINTINLLQIDGYGINDFGDKKYDIWCFVSNVNNINYYYAHQRTRHRDCDCDDNIIIVPVKNPRRFCFDRILEEDGTYFEFRFYDLIEKKEIY